MAHILWIILKVILTVLAVLIGLVVLILLVVLFCPICYKASILKKEEDRLRDTDAAADISWLFHLISIAASLQHGKTAVSVRIFGIPLEKILNRGRGKAAGAESTPEEFQEKPEKPPEEEIQEALKEEPSEQPASGDEIVPDREEEQEPQEEGSEPQEEGSEPQEEGPEPQEEKTGSQECISEAPGEKGKVSAFFRSMKEKISAAFQKIRVLAEKAEWWKDFITDERTGFALECVLRELKKILHHILPRKITGHARFGFEDPSITGRILAACGMSIPLHRNRIELDPVFEERDILDVDSEFKGRIYLIRLAVSAVIILLNKDVWFVINTLKHKEE